jgi:hypothetical protein
MKMNFWLQQHEHIYKQCQCINSKHKQLILIQSLNKVFSICEVSYIRRRENNQQSNSIS